MTYWLYRMMVIVAFIAALPGCAAQNHRAVDWANLNYGGLESYKK